MSDIMMEIFKVEVPFGLQQTVSTWVLSEWLDAGAKVEHMPDGQILNGRFRFPIFGAFI